MKSEVIFYQLFEHESSTYTYLIGDAETKEAALIDPVLSTVDRDLKLIEELGLKLKFVLDTHIHADHITGAGEIRKRTGAKTGVSHQAGVDCVDLPLKEGETLSLGARKVEVIETPGHTNTCLSYAFEGMLFTGDSLMIRGTGRTDFQEGSSENLYDSIQNKLFRWPDETKVYPGHDYRGQTSSTIGLEKKFNPRIGAGKTRAEFKKVMSELKLANPKKIHEAVPANLKCGLGLRTQALHVQVVDGIPEVLCPEVHKNLGGKFRIVDVRGVEEFNNELGHIAGAELRVLGPDLIKFLETGDREEEIVFVCRSGGRSGQATHAAIQMGYKMVSNMVGGMIRWNELGFAVEKQA